jgi:AraC-like DNA-binding protein
MSSILAFNPESILGFQIIYYNNNNVKYSIALGTLGDTVTEISINTSTLSLKNVGFYEHINFSLSTKTKRANNLPSTQVSPLPNTLIIKYSKELFSLFTIKQQFKSSNHSIEVFKSDYNILNNTKFGIIPQKHLHLVKSIIGLISRPVIVPESFYELIQVLSQVVIESNTDSLVTHESIHPLSSELVQIVNCVISNNFTYPQSKEIRRITRLSKKTFEKEVRFYTPGTLKTYLSEIQFKSELYQIIYTKKRFQDIALEHGFSDQSAFTRSIKSRTGFSPRILRKNGKEGLFNLLPKTSDQFLK